MGKLDHIPELTGPDTYFAWKREVTYALGIEDQWCHVTDTVDPDDVLGCASFKPIPADPCLPTAAESKAIREWLINDLKAKSIITRHLSMTVQQLISTHHSVTARDAWSILSSHFRRVDMGSQHVVRQSLYALQMKDAADASNYVGQHCVLRERLLRMGVVYTDAEAVFQLLHGLPKTGTWPQFKALITLTLPMHTLTSVSSFGSASVTAGSLCAPSSSTSPLPSASAFDACVACISAEAARLIDENILAGGAPGSEYANAATTQPSSTGAVNSITGLRKHRHNPDGVFCTTVGCNKGDHDHAHCYAKGGGMAGQAPWMKGKDKEKKTETATAAVIPPPAPAATAPPATTITAFAGTLNAADSFLADLSCASIVEEPDVDTTVLSCIVAAGFNTILDSGTTTTLIQDRSYFWSYSTADAVTVRTANHGSLGTSGRGDCVALLTIGGNRHRVRLSNCLHAPSAMLNLLSVGWMLSKGWDCVFRASPPRCELVYRGTELGAIPMANNLCYVNLEFLPAPQSCPSVMLTLPPSPPDLSAFTHVTPTLDLWHARLGHIGGEAVHRLPLFATGATVSPGSALSKCESCIMGKHPRRPHPPSKSPRAARFLDIIHSDLCGPIPVITPHNKRYFIVFLDDHTNILNLQLLVTKDQALDAWRLVRARWETQSGSHVKVFRSDNGGEFLNAAFTADLEAAGIVRQLSAPYSHQQNGKAERVLRTIEGRMYAMLNYARLPRSLWGEAALCAAYLFNRSESRALLPGKTPYEMLHGAKPDVSHLRVFGARCFVRILTELQEKLGPRSREAIFMGYPPGVKAWRCRDSTMGAFFNSRDIIFDESFSTRPFPTSDSDDEDDTAIVEPLSSPVVDTTPSSATPSVPATDAPVHRSGRTLIPTEKGRLFHECLAADAARLNRQRDLRLARIQGVPPADGIPSLVPPVPIATRSVILPAPSHPLPVSDDLNADAICIDDETVGFPHVLANLIVSELACISIRSDTRRNPHAPGYNMKIPPNTYDEAMRRSDRDSWLAAMKREMNLMSEMNVYELVPLPSDRKSIGCRWVLEFREDLKGGSVFKARLVAQGFSQVPGIDFGKMFAPVAKAASIRIISALAAHNNWELDAFDAKRVFLWGKLTEDMYMRQPPGFERFAACGGLLVCHLLSSLYGLKQAAYDWYELLREVLTHLGFLCIEADYAVFVYDHVNTEGEHIICIIAWHVDDGLAAASNRPFLVWIKGQIVQRFGITDLGPVSKHLGIQFEQNRTTCELWMHQTDYITYLLEEHGMLGCNSITLPMDPHFPFGRDTDLHPHIENLTSEYRKIVGELLYLAMYMRPDIAVAVMKLTQHNSSPESRHYAAAKHVLRFLAGTLGLRTHYGGVTAMPELHGFSDSDWASCPEDRISISGYVWFFNGGPVSHSSKKQLTHALSSTEAEYMVLTAAIQDGLWLTSFFECLKIPLTFLLRLFADNAGAIALSEEAANHIRTKHIDLRYHFIHAHIEEGTFKPEWLSTHKNVADIFTKCLPSPLFLRHQSGLSLLCR